MVAHVAVGELRRDDEPIPLDADVQAGFDRDLVVDGLRTALPREWRDPGSPYILGEPDRQIAARAQGLFVLRPVLNAVRGLVLRVEFRRLRHGTARWETPHGPHVSETEGNDSRPNAPLRAEYWRGCALVGWNSDGQLGDGETFSSNVPVSVVNAP